MEEQEVKIASCYVNCNFTFRRLAPAHGHSIPGIEASTNLLDWLPLATNRLNGSPLPFTDSATASLRMRFYRVQVQ